MMGVGAKRAIGLYRSCAPRQVVGINEATLRLDRAQREGQGRPRKDVSLPWSFFHIETRSTMFASDVPSTPIIDLCGPRGWSVRPDTARPPGAHSG